MTLVVWAACDNYALMLADRRLYNGRVVATADGAGTELGELAIGEDLTKAVLAQDGRDIFGVAGAGPVFNIINQTISAHGPDADRMLTAAVLSGVHVEMAFDSAYLPHPNAVLHAYAHAGRIVATRIEWSPTIFRREVMVAPKDKVMVAAAGSGMVYLQGLATADVNWAAMERSITEWESTKSYLLRLFRAVTVVDMGVGPDVDVWLLQKSTGVWLFQGTDRPTIPIAAKGASITTGGPTK